MSELLYAVIDADYKNQVKKFDEEKVLKDSIVFIGDSIIDYFDTNKYYDNDNLVNRGIAGDTTRGVLNRLDQIINIKPKVVVLSIGSNDITRYHSSVSEIVKSILQIKYELETNIENVKVYILSLTPVLRDHAITNNIYMKTRNNDIIDEINDELTIYTKIIDTNGCLKDSNNNLKLDYTVDGLHLTELGYQVFSSVIANAINELKLKEKIKNEQIHNCF